MNGMRRFVWLIALLICALCGQRFVALAETSEAQDQEHILSISLVANPSELVMPGDVTLTFTIVNTSEEYDATNVYLSSSDGLRTEPIGQINAGESQVFNRTHTVTQEELDAGQISYIISHDGLLQSEEKVNYSPTHCLIEKAIAQPGVEFTRQFSSDCARVGDVVTVTYRVRNTGNVQITSLRVRDSLGDFTSGRVDVLDVGESKLFTSKVTVSQEAVSSPTLTYNVPYIGQEDCTQELEDRRIRIAQENLTATLSIDRSEAAYGESAQLQLTLMNLGNVDMYDIRVTDARDGGLIADSLQMIHGCQPLTITRTVAVREDATYQWRVVATSQSGRQVEILTDPVGLALTPSPEEPPLIDVSAETEYSVIDRSGEIEVDVYLTNPGTASVENVVLREDSQGELHTFAVLAPGITCRRVRLSVDEDTELVFTASYANASGEMRLSYAEPLSIRIGRDGVSPIRSQDEESPFGGESVKMGEHSGMFLIMIIVASVVLVALTVALLLSSRKAKRARRQRLAAIKKRQQEELGKTNRFTPVKRPDRNRKAE